MAIWGLRLAYGSCKTLDLRVELRWLTSWCAEPTGSKKNNFFIELGDKSLPRRRYDAPMISEE